MKFTRLRSLYKTHTPPGMPMKGEYGFFITGWCAALLYTLLFVLRYVNARADLYGCDPATGRRVLLAGAVITDFSELFDGAWTGFFLLAVCMVGFAVWHYAYFRLGTQSIYLMRRLPDPWELHRRCLTLPCLCIAVCLVSAGLCLWFSYLIYVCFTPDICLPAGFPTSFSLCFPEVTLMLELKNVNKFYGTRRALCDVNLSLDRGEIVGLFGENGAGKTTLMKSILGFHAFSGEITLDGENITPANVTRLSFATSEHSFFANLTADAHRDFYEGHFDTFNKKRYAALMDFFSLPHHKPLRAFSTGQKNQFEVILALSQGADYILMDEPFAGNDIFNREDFYKVLLGILEPHETVLLSTHLIEEVSDFIGRAVLLQNGHIIKNVTTDEIEEQGMTLVDYIKTCYRYQGDRVSKALSELSELSDMSDTSVNT